ncbi:MAG: hypothetical protein IJR65_07230, partial [Oscillospiraceae bacterium]|nr:hypothetical protein [Oscillospiraceae bacterium]
MTDFSLSCRCGGTLPRWGRERSVGAAALGGPHPRSPLADFSLSCRCGGTLPRWGRERIVG